jgi:tetratricopeptide (TPR) repeat protein
VCAARRQAGTHIVGRAVLAFFWTFFLFGDAARASVCPSVPFNGRGGADPEAELSHEEALLAGGTYLSAKKWPEARGVYIWMLSKDPNDMEALGALARVDAWDGCWQLSEREYARVLTAHPEDIDTRAGYVDLLTWQNRFNEAGRLLNEGLAADPDAAPLLIRRARMAYWRGDTLEAVHLADRAVQLSPEDGDLRAMRDKMFLGEARLTARLDHYPPGYQDLYTMSGQVLQRIGRYEVYGGTALVQRYGGADGVAPVTDLQFPVGVLYHPALGFVLGAEIAIGAPAHAIPNFQGKVSLLAPIVPRWTGTFSYSFWNYSAGETVHIFAPGVSWTPLEKFRFDLTAYVSAVRIPDQRDALGNLKATASASLAPAIGIQAAYVHSSRLEFAVGYTYGAELDQDPAVYQLLTIRQNAVHAYADYLFDRSFGMRPVVEFERRESTDSGAIALVESVELGAYYRW